MITRALALIGFALACLPSQAVADSGRRSFTLPDTAFDALPPPVPPIDIRGEHIFSLSGLLEMIESIPDLFDQRDYWRTLHTFRKLELDDSLPALSASEVHYTIEVTGDWSFEHTGTGQMLKLYSEDEVLHRLNLELPGHEYPWQFAARVPRDGSDVIRRQLVGQLDTVSGNYRDIRAHGFEAVFGAAAQHLFQPRRFPGFSDAEFRGHSRKRNLRQHLHRRRGREPPRRYARSGGGGVPHPGAGTGIHY